MSYYGKKKKLVNVHKKVANMMEKFYNIIFFFKKEKNNLNFSQPK